MANVQASGETGYRMCSQHQSYPAAEMIFCVTSFLRYVRVDLICDLVLTGLLTAYVGGCRNPSMLSRHR